MRGAIPGAQNLRLASSSTMRGTTSKMQDTYKLQCAEQFLEHNHLRFATVLSDRTHDLGEKVARPRFVTPTGIQHGHPVPKRYGPSQNRQMLSEISERRNTVRFTSKSCEKVNSGSRKIGIILNHIKSGHQAVPLPHTSRSMKLKVVGRTQSQCTHR